jgi:hypothetical protein
MDIVVKIFVCISLFLGIQAELRWLESLDEEEEVRERLIRFTDFCEKNQEKEDEEDDSSTEDE